MTLDAGSPRMPLRTEVILLQFFEKHSFDQLLCLGMPTGVAVPTVSSGFRLSSPYLCVMSATTLSCGTTVALDCSDC